ncbi:ABC transporter permease [Egibacter rhizosphaerae]|uniref:ABC transporter permease n=1 Tax=Egibacter rhizosphaerae TaxID=1670831 RepID=A0A411YI46_9ACTN|nr:ABC transporter permease [Egibacter rhizosphaerae]QBI20801.1 ABC transporter permease [Egibacter rhizosphaerae]
MTDTVQHVDDRTRPGDARRSGSWRRLGKRLRRQPGLALGLLILALLLAIVAAPWLFTNADPNVVNPAERLSPPSGEHWFGTDDVGRDIYARVIYGTRVTLGILLASLAFAGVLGGTSGIVAGYLGRSTDMLFGRGVDVILSFPPLILGLILTGILGAGTQNLVLAMSVIYFPTFFRIGRSGTMSESTKVYAEAAYALGYSRFRILSRHIARNVVPLLLAQLMVVFPLALQIQAALSFLGLGVQPPTPDWGNILEQSQNFLLAAPWMSAFPGLAILVSALGMILLGRAAQASVDDA